MKKREKKLYSEQPSMFAVSYKEIAKRSFFAGFMSGIGALTATLIGGFIISVIIVGIIAPQLGSILFSTRTTLEKAGFFTPSNSSPQP